MEASVVGEGKSGVEEGRGRGGVGMGGGCGGMAAAGLFRGIFFLKKKNLGHPCRSKFFFLFFLNNKSHSSLYNRTAQIKTPGPLCVYIYIYTKERVVQN